MARRHLSGILVVLWSAPLTAQPVAEIEGHYHAEVMEVGSQLSLSADGRFVWLFSSGALDVAAEGRWTRETEGSIRLDSAPAVTPPRFELVGRSRDAQPGVAVRLACDSRRAAQFLDVVIEYADGERFTDHFAGVEYRTDGSRPVAAVQVGSGPFDLMSERFPVDAAEANVVTVRFVRNDLGRIDFQGQLASVANGVLSMEWRAMPLRYRRQGSTAGQDFQQLPRPARAEPEAAPFATAVTLGEPMADLQARAGAGLAGGEGMFAARGPVDLRLGYGGHSIDLGRIDARQQPLLVVDSGGDGRVSGVAFDYAPGLLPLDEALTRAQAFRQWLEQAGFAQQPGGERLGDQPAFTVVPEDGSEGARATDWADAARMLGDEAQAVSAMELYGLRTQSHYAGVRLENVRRHERLVCPHAEWAGEAGREWRLMVTINASRSPTPQS